MINNVCKQCKQCKHAMKRKSDFPCKSCMFKVYGLADFFQYNDGCAGVYHTCQSCLYRERSDSDTPCRNCYVKEGRRTNNYED